MRLKNIKTTYEGTYGAQLDAPSTTSEAHVLMAADEKTLNWARVHWPQFSEDDIDWTPAGKMKVTHKETCERLRIALGSPLGHEEFSGVIAFVVRDSRLILLERIGAARPSSTIYHGEIVGRKLTANDKPGRIL